MKKNKLITVLSAVAVLVATVVTPAVSVDAATTTITNSNYLYGEEYYYSVTDLTINGKKPTKLTSSLKKSLRVAKTATRKKGVTTVKAAYTAGNAKKSYAKTYDYSIEFLKSGTYTFKYKTTEPTKRYGREYYDFRDLYQCTIVYYDSSDNPIGTTEFESSDYVYQSEMSSYLDATYTTRADYSYWDGDCIYGGYTRYQIETTDTATGNSTLSKALYKEEQDANNNTYYISEDGKSIYAQSPDLGVMVPAKLVSNQLSYQPLSYKTITTTEKVKVENTEVPIVKSVTLGNGKISSSYTNEDGGYTLSATYNRHLSGSKGKVNVSMGSNSKLMDIVIKTYDKNGEEVYKLVKNKSTVTYGKYAYQYSSSSDYSDYSTTNFFKETEVFVFYKDKLNGGYTDIQSVKYDEKTKSYKFTYKYKSPTASKAVKQTTAYLPTSYGIQYEFYK